MANSLREVKSRISSTKSTAQITKAMYMVSESKLRRAEKTFKAYENFMVHMSSMVKGIVDEAKDDYSHPLMVKRDVKKTAFFIITSDKGLAGAYNSSIFKALEEKIKELGLKEDDFITGAVGKQGFNYLRKRKYPLLNDAPVYIRDDVMFVDIADLSKSFIDLYLEKKIDKLVIVYNHFVNTLRSEIRFEELLPIKKVEGEANHNINYSYESGLEKTMDLILPMYAQDIIYGIILDAKASEHASRMNSMKSATDNADEIIQKLQLLYNRARQNEVTSELIDIIGGANAIGG
jgi:F-type H+-transporting ATPase subunit gamma